MKISIFLLLTIRALPLGSLMAQSNKSDAARLHLKGDVRSVLETTRNGKHQVVGQPIRYTFDARGNYERVEYFDTAGTLAISVLYSYDKRGNLMKDNRLSEPFNHLDAVTDYAYDKKSRTLTATMLEIDDTNTYRTTYTYDRLGNEVEVRLFDEKGDTLGSEAKEYDTYGNMVRKTYYQGTNHLYRGETIYRYDTDGNVVEENNMDLNRVTWALLYSYAFDEQGNWTVCYKFRVTTSEASLYEIVSRKITYNE